MGTVIKMGVWRQKDWKLSHFFRNRKGKPKQPPDAFVNLLLFFILFFFLSLRLFDRCRVQITLPKKECSATAVENRNCDQFALGGKMTVASTGEGESVGKELPSELDVFLFVCVSFPNTCKTRGVFLSRYKQ